MNAVSHRARVGCVRYMRAIVDRVVTTGCISGESLMIDNNYSKLPDIYYCWLHKKYVEK